MAKRLRTRNCRCHSNSENREDSWAFLDRRLEHVMRIGRLKGKLQRIFPSPGMIARLIKGSRRPRFG